MLIDNANHGEGGSSLDDVAYLVRSSHRLSTLRALTVRPRSRSELCELTGVSSSTIRRTLAEFEERTWVRRDDYRYVATRLGEVAASGMDDLLERLDTERTLRDVWYWLPEDVREFGIETWMEMTVTVAEPASPYRPVNRFESLLRNADDFRFLRPEVGLMDPCLDRLQRLLDDGVEVTLVDRPGAHRYFLSTYPERASTMLEYDNFTVLVRDDLPPNGVGLLDDRVAITCVEQDSGTVKALVDTDAPTVRAWAESVYTSHESDAQPLEPQRIVE